MRISSKTDYALKTVLDLAMHRNEGPIRVADIADRHRIPVKFLEQILITLKGSGIVASRRGAKGGYILAVPPSKIKLAAIVQLTEDSLLSGSARARTGGRNSGDSQESPFDELWTDINDYITAKLEEATMADMCKRAKMLASDRAPEYCI